MNEIFDASQARRPRTPWLRAGSGLHACWSRLRQRHTHAPPALDTGAAATGPSAAAGTVGGTAAAATGALWRMRTTVREEPGSLAALCTALAREQIDIVSLQTHPLGPVRLMSTAETGGYGTGGYESGGDWTLDEFLLRVPGPLEAADLRRIVTDAGGLDTWTERADAHDLVDTPTRVLGLATRTALDTAELPLALRQLLGRCTIRSVPARSLTGRPAAPDVPPGGEVDGTVLRLPDPAGGALIVERPQLPFTPAEFARARALVELDARLGGGAGGGRVPDRRDALTLPEGQDITIRRAGPDDLDAARAMHERCSHDTLAQRYHGPVADADRYLGHLLSPRFGRTLAVETVSGRLVALGHLLWDGDETEVALLVEDAWQRRGIGEELLRRLTELAVEARTENVYAVTQASNTAMVATMRALGLPLDYQVEEGTLVITAQVPAGPEPTAAGPRGEGTRVSRPSR